MPTNQFLWVAALVLFTGCSSPDGTGRSLPELPGAAEAFLIPDSIRALRIADGAVYYYLWAPRGPWAVHAVAADVTRCDLTGTVVAAPSDGAGRHRTKVSDLRPDAPGVAFAGINGDFFTDAGLPVGPEVHDAAATGGARPAFAWGLGRAPWIGQSGDADGATTFGHYGGLPEDGAVADYDALGGFPVLLEDGAVVGDLEVEARPAFAAARHPRSAVGYDEDGGRLWLVTVDGRQEPYSAGMTLPELTQLLHALGAEDALNLDGGGSTAMWVRGQVMNRPSDPTGERPVANSLWLNDLPGRCSQGP